MHDTRPTGTPVDLATHDLHLLAGGALRADERRFEDGEPDQRTAAIFHVETDEDGHAAEWEMHPSGDEAVCCLRGAIRLYLRAAEPGTPDDVVRLLPGQAAIVPRDRWHRFEVDEPTDLLAVTPRHGTRLESRAPTP